MAKPSGTSGQAAVALLAEGVDRNTSKPMKHELPRVALLAEGVDRNNRNVARINARTSRPPRGGRG